MLQKVVDDGVGLELPSRFALQALQDIHVIGDTPFSVFGFGFVSHPSYQRQLSNGIHARFLAVLRPFIQAVLDLFWQCYVFKHSYLLLPTFVAPIILRQRHSCLLPEDLPVLGCCPEVEFVVSFIAALFHTEGVALDP